MRNFILATILVSALTGIFFAMPNCPWTIVPKSRIADLESSLREAEAKAAQPSSRPRQAAVEAPHRTRFFDDPTYRTSLEKTTVAGSPELAKERESGLRR